MKNFKKYIIDFFKSKKDKQSNDSPFISKSVRKVGTKMKVKGWDYKNSGGFNITILPRGAGKFLSIGPDDDEFSIDFDKQNVQKLIKILSEELRKHTEERNIFYKNPTKMEVWYSECDETSGKGIKILPFGINDYMAIVGGSFDIHLTEENVKELIKIISKELSKMK